LELGTISHLVSSGKKGKCKGMSEEMLYAININDGRN
jgi:hypothetical protein